MKSKAWHYPMDDDTRTLDNCSRNQHQQTKKIMQMQKHISLRWKTGSATRITGGNQMYMAQCAVLMTSPLTMGAQTMLFEVGVKTGKEIFVGQQQYRTSRCRILQLA